MSLNVAAVAALTVAAPAFAQLAPGPNPVTGTVTTAQTLSAGTGTVASGGKIVTSGSTVAVTMSGTSTLVNGGTVQQTGTGRAIDSAAANSNLTVTNTGLISSVSTDAFRVNANSAVLLNNSGTIQVTNGGQAIDWAAITSKSNVLNNLAGGVITAVGEDAVRMGTNGVLNNQGTISATPTGTTDPSGSDGIDLRTFTGIQVTNSGTIMGRHGIATDGSNAGTTNFTVTNNAGGLIAAVNGSGLNIDGVFSTVTANVTNQFGATFRGGVLASALEGDGDGIDVDGVLTINNSGDVLGLGARGPNNAEGIAAGGGSITNNSTGRIIGSSLLVDAPNGDASRGGNGILIDNSSGGSAVAATTVANSGLIQGKSGFGIQIVGTFADTITNNAGGTIRGAGASATLQTGGGNDIVTNRGAIVSDSGNAIDLQDGNDQLIVEGGSASIVGSVSGGAGSNTATLKPGTGNTFAYSGSLANFDTVEVQSGTVTLSGASTYTGNTVVSGGTLVLDGANRIASGSGLVLNGGTLEVLNAGGANGQTFSSLSLAAPSALDLDSTSLTFSALSSIASGKTLSIVDWSAATSPDYAIRFVGDYSSNVAFLLLMGATTVNGLAAVYNFDGMFTNVLAPAVPLPATLWMLVSGLGLLGGLRRRKQAANAI